MVTQWRLVSPAVGQHPVTLIGKSLVMQLLERPDDALHKGDVKRLVIVLEVNPAGLPRHILLPLGGVAQDGFFGGLVESRNTHLLDLALVRNAELALRFQLGGQTVSVPAKSAVDLLSAHGVEAGEHIFCIPGEEVAVVG